MIKRDVKYPGRWAAADADFPLGGPKNRTTDTSLDGSYFSRDFIADYEAFFQRLMTEGGITANEVADTVPTSQIFEALSFIIEADPLNNDWNGYLDPDHQSNLPAPNGYPGASGGGEVAYSADEEISLGIFAGASGATVGADSDGWIFTGSIYKEYEYTTEQIALIDVDKITVYIKGQDGSVHFASNATTGVAVAKIGGKLRVTIGDGTLAVIGITKLWRFFVTDKVGIVTEKSVDVVANLIEKQLESRREWSFVTGSRAPAILYTNDTGCDIELRVTISPTGVSGQWGGSLLINGSSSDVYASDPNRALAPNNSYTLSGLVPKGRTYSVTLNSSSVVNWRELRV